MVADLKPGIRAASCRPGAAKFGKIICAAESWITRKRHRAIFETLTPTRDAPTDRRLVFDAGPKSSSRMIDSEFRHPVQTGHRVQDRVSPRGTSDPEEQRILASADIKFQESKWEPLLF